MSLKSVSPSQLLRVPPQDIGAEEAVFGAMLINPGCRSFVKSNLDASDFYREAHKTLFPIVTGSDGDLIAIVGELKGKGLLEQIGGADYLSKLMDDISTSAAVRHHIELVKEASHKRHLVTISQNLIHKSGGATAEELSEYLRQGLNRLDIRDGFGQRRGVDIHNVYDAQKMLKEYAGYVETLKQNRFITGIHEIDRRIRGVGPGEVLYFIARAGSFKTATLQNLQKNYVQHSAWGAVFFSLEMPIPSVTERFHQMIQGLAGRDIEDYYTHPDAVEDRKDLETRFLKEMDRLYTVPVKVGVSEIMQYTRLIEKEHKVKIGLIGIDYLGMMDGQGQGEYEIVSKLARDIKGMAKLLHIPVIVLAQTSRKAEQGETEIKLDMGRGSGAIEESGDFVLGLFQVERKRPAIECAESEFDLICKILKNRKGGRGSMWKLDLEPQTLKIGADAVKWEPPKRQRKDVLQ